MEYRCVTTSVEGFVQQLAVAYITHGYWFYVTGEIPEGKDPAAVDAKLIERYGIAISKWARCRRKKQGFANMQYLRHERFFVLLATKGRHEFFERERESLRDFRREPITFGDYSISCRRGRDGKWHSSVRMRAQVYAEVQAYIADQSCAVDANHCAREFARLNFESYAPIRRQLLMLHRHVNRRRAVAGLSQVPASVVLQKRSVTRPFDLRAKSDFGRKSVEDYF